MAIHFMITLVSVLKSVDKAFFEGVFEMFWCKCESFVFEQASMNYLLILKKFILFPYLLDSVILPLFSRKPYRWLFLGT